MAVTTGLAGLGMETPVSSIMPAQAEKKVPEDESNRYKALFNAMYKIFYPTKAEQVDQQTDLQWVNIEGEVMLEVLKMDIISGVPLAQLDDDPYFRYASPQECLDKVIADKFVEKMQERYLLPSMTSLKRNLNLLLVSEGRKGRIELVQAFSALTFSMQEHEHNESLMKPKGFRLT
jgi:hypothetical protein